MTMVRGVLLMLLTVLIAPRARTQEEGLAGRLYRTQLVAAEALYRLNQIGEAKRVLSETDPRSRGWEWQLLRSRTDRSARTLSVHSGRVTALAVSPDGKWVASGSEDSTIVFTDADSGERVSTLRGHTGRVSTLDFSPDGTRLVSGSTDRTVRIWDTGSRKQVRSSAGEFARGIYQAKFSHDGSMIGVASWEYSPGNKLPVVGFASVLDARAGTVIRRFNTDGHPAASIAFTPDDGKIFSGTWGFHVKRHDIRSGSTDWDHDLSKLDYYAAVQSVDASSDGMFVVECGKDNRIRLLNAVDGMLVYAIEPWQGHREWVNGVRFSPDGRYFVSGSDDGLVCVWRTATGTMHRAFRGHEGGVHQVAWHPSGQKIYSASADRTVKEWRVDRPGDLQFDACDNGPWNAPVSPSGSLIAVAGGDRSFSLWDLNSGGWVRLLDSLPGTAAAFSSDGKLVALGSSTTIRCYAVDSGRKLFEATGHSGSVYGLAYHAGQHLFASTGDRTVRLWNASSGAPVRVIETGSAAYVVQFAPDGSEMIVGCTDGAVKIYSTTTWQISDSLRSSTSIFNLAVSPGGEYFVTGGDRGECFVWNLKQPSLRHRLTGHTNWVYGVACHPRLPYAVTASYDRTVRIWDTRDGSCVLTLGGYADPLYTASIDQSGNRFVVTTVEGTVHVVDISEL